MNKAEMSKSKSCRNKLCPLRPAKLKYYRAWIIGSYDVRGTWVAHNYDELPGFEFLKKRGK